jgi:hypothetical protein
MEVERNEMENDEQITVSQAMGAFIDKLAELKNEQAELRSLITMQQEAIRMLGEVIKGHQVIFEAMQPAPAIPVVSTVN